MQDLAKDFLAQKRIAIVGVTRDKQGWGRTLYDEFKKRGYDTYAVNPARAPPIAPERFFVRHTDVDDCRAL